MDFVITVIFHHYFKILSSISYIDFIIQCKEKMLQTTFPPIFFFCFVTYSIFLDHYYFMYKMLEVYPCPNILYVKKNREFFSKKIPPFVLILQRLCFKKSFR